MLFIKLVFLAHKASICLLKTQKKALLKERGHVCDVIMLYLLWSNCRVLCSPCGKGRLVSSQIKHSTYVCSTGWAFRCFRRAQIVQCASQPPPWGIIILVVVAEYSGTILNRMKFSEQLKSLPLLLREKCLYYSSWHTKQTCRCLSNKLEVQLSRTYTPCGSRWSMVPLLKGMLCW